MASLREGSDVPWHRVVGRRGRGVAVSLEGGRGALQRALLADEGVRVDAAGVVDGAAEWFGSAYDASSSDE